jgi:hypothetical protein
MIEPRMMRHRGSHPLAMDERGDLVSASRAGRGCDEQRSRADAYGEQRNCKTGPRSSRDDARRRRGMGVEPTQQRMAPPTGFEARPTHQDRFLSKKSGVRITPTP